MQKGKIIRKKENYLQRTEWNLINQRTNNFLQKDNLITSFDKFKTSNINQNQNNLYLKRYYSDKDEDIFDIRLYFCLKKLGILYLQKIFEKNNINFDDLLTLSANDLFNLGCQKEEIIIIKKFTLDYIKKASFYSIEEVQNYFKNNIKLYRNSRKIHSVKESNQIRKNMDYSIKKDGSIHRRNNTYQNVNNIKNSNITNNINDMKINNYINKDYNSYLDKEYYRTTYNEDNNNLLNNYDQFKKIIN